MAEENDAVGVEAHANAIEAEGAEAAPAADSVVEAAEAQFAPAVDDVGGTLGKRKSREEEAGNGEAAGSLKKHKILVPEDLLNDIGLHGVQQITKPSAMRSIEEKSGASITLRGGDSPEDPQGGEPLHLVVEGNEEAIAIASMSLEKMLNDPDELAKLKATITRKHKIYIPEKVKEEVNILGVLIGVKGAMLKAMQDRSGARISIRGKGSSRDEEDKEDPLHVHIEGTDAAIAIATKEIEYILHTPGEAVRLKQQQLMDLANMKATRHQQQFQPPQYGGGYQHHQPSGGYNSGGGGGGGSYGTVGRGGYHDNAPPTHHYGGQPPPHMYGAPPTQQFGMGGIGMYPANGPGGAPPVNYPPPNPTGVFTEDGMTFTIPNGVVGIVVGRQGQNIQKVQNDFNVNVQLSKLEGNGPEDVPIPVILKGSRDACEGARLAILATISERQALQSANGHQQQQQQHVPQHHQQQPPFVQPPQYQPYQQPPPQQQPPQHHHAAPASHYSPLQGRPAPAAPVVPAVQPQEVISLVPSTPQIAISVVVPNDKVGLIIGKQGVTIKAMQIKTGAKLQIPQGPDLADPSKRTLTVIATTREAADACTREIATVLEQGPSTAPPGSMTFTVPSERVGLILGKGGLTVKDIQVRTGASIRIDIPQAGEPGYSNPTRTITIHGPGDTGQRARAEIEALVSTGFEQGAGGYYASEDSSGGLIDPYRQPAHQQQPYHIAAAAAAAAQAQQQAAAAAAAAQQQQYAAYDYAAQQQAAATAGTDLTQYYAQFWQYAAYYGEKVAREHYGVWSPPVGSQPPPGIVLPQPGQEQPAPQV